MREVQGDPHLNEYPPSIHLLDLFINATQWMKPSRDDPNYAAQQAKISELIHNWTLRNSILEIAVALCNYSPLPYYDQFVLRFVPVLEILCLHDTQILEQLLSGIHELLAHEDDALPVSVIANAVGSNAESMHRRRLPREYSGDDLDDRVGLNAYNAATVYNDNFLLATLSFILYNVPAPSPASPTPSSSSSSSPAPSLSPFAPTLIELVILAAKNALVQQRQPYAVKQHNAFQLALLQFQIQTEQQPKQQPPTPPATSFTQAVDLLRQLWDSSQFGPLVRENRTLDVLIAQTLIDGISFYFDCDFLYKYSTIGAPLLDVHPTTMETIVQFYTHCAKYFTPMSREALSNSIGEKISRLVNNYKRDKLTGSWVFENLIALVQVLSILTIMRTKYECQ